MDMVHWATCMLAFNAIPPDPAVVGDGWRKRWLARLDGTPPFIEAWLSHQRRDAYWQQGSVRDDYAAIACPVMAVAGWAGRLHRRRPAPAGRARRAAAGADRALGPRRPGARQPGTGVGILSEYVRWWDRWLKGIANGIDEEPALVAYLQDSGAAGRQPRGAAGTLDRRARVAVAARRGAFAAARPRHARRAAGRPGPPADRLRAVRGGRRRRLVRGRQVGRPAARPAHRGRSLARVRLRAAGARPRGARLRRGAPRAGLRPTARARQRASLRAPARRRLAARARAASSTSATAARTPSRSRSCRARRSRSP